VAILRDLSGDPMFLPERGNQVAHQLRLPDASRVPADNDHLPPHAS
jgi:hypothetical protein